MKILKLLFLSVVLLMCSTSCNTDADQPSEYKDQPTKSIATTDESEKPVKPAAFESALKKVDQLPLFGGCEDWNCSNTKLIAYIQDHLKYPEEAKEATIEGKVYIQFIVESDGSVSNTFIAKDIGGGCGAAAAALVNQMNELDKKWSPGIHEGEPVDVVFTLPFSFKLQRDS